MSNEACQGRKLERARYIPVWSRIDCCGHCRHSGMPPSAHKLVCRLHSSAEVSKLAICSMYEPKKNLRDESR